METEVKLAFKDRESLLYAASSEWFASHCRDLEGRSLTLQNHYLDTLDHKLGSRGVSLRKRHYLSDAADSYEFTVKYKGEVESGLHKHFEWNLKSSDGIFDIEFFKRNAGGDDRGLLEDLLAGIGDKDLVILCSNEFERVYRDFRYKESKMEACIDYGEIKDPEGKTCDIICEIELELMEGNTGDLTDAGKEIVERFGAVLFDETKFARTLKFSVTGGDL